MMNIKSDRRIRSLKYCFPASSISSVFLQNLGCASRTELSGYFLGAFLEKNTTEDSENQMPVTHLQGSIQSDLSLLALLLFVNREPYRLEKVYEDMDPC